MIRQFLKSVFIAAGLSIACVAAPYAQDTVIPLWPGKAPGSEKWLRQEVTTTYGGHAVVRNVVTPTLTKYAPAPGTANGSAVIICPGGGYLFLTMDSEGREVADWLTARGVTAFVLKYRLSSSGSSELAFKFNTLKFLVDVGMHSLFGKKDTLPSSNRIAAIRPLAAADGLQAMKLVREHAGAWGLDPHRIGMIGFSAGGAVVNDVATGYDAASRPNFIASIYSIGLSAPTIPVDAPTLFLAAANDDPIVPVQLSIDMDAHWREAGHRSELHIYDDGGHGFGMKKQQKTSDRWIDDYEHWLRLQRIIGAQ